MTRPLRLLCSRCLSTRPCTESRVGRPEGGVARASTAAPAIARTAFLFQLLADAVNGHHGAGVRTRTPGARRGPRPCGWGRGSAAAPGPQERAGGPRRPCRCRPTAGGGRGAGAAGGCVTAWGDQRDGLRRLLPARPEPPGRAAHGRLGVPACAVTPGRGQGLAAPTQNGRTSPAGSPHIRSAGNLKRCAKKIVKVHFPFV